MQGIESHYFAPGALLAGKYRVERVIGQGGMGVVVEARHVQLEERVALKFLLPEFATQPDATERFLREARAAVRIRGEHVARVSDVGTLENGSPYMVMEFLEGRDLSEVLDEQNVLPVEDAVDCIVQACDAIAEAHAHGIVHRDLKPANLFLARRMDGSPLVKVLDFGISKVMDQQGISQLTRTSTTMGSGMYMSPEQIRDTRSVDHRTDIYALGITLYELLSGRQPFDAETFPQLCVMIATTLPIPLRSVRPDLPEGLVAVVEHAFARDRDNRFQSIAELALGLAPWAPKRSQPIIERIARTAGLAAPEPMTRTAASGPATGAAAQPHVITDLSSSAPAPAPARKTGTTGLWVGLGAGLLTLVAVAVIAGALLLRSRRANDAATSSNSAEVAAAAAPPGVAPASSAAEATPGATPEPSASVAEAPPSASVAEAPPSASAAPTPKPAPAIHAPAILHRPATHVAAPKPAATPAPAPTRNADEYR